jgi:hypothetical protein
MPRLVKSSEKGPPHRIEIGVRDIEQLFNTMDPSPFYEKDLDADAEEFILSWAQEFPARDAIELVVHVLQRPAKGAATPAMLERAVRHYFLYRTRLERLSLSRLLRDARTSLVIGVAFLVVCVALGELLGNRGWGLPIREGLVIAGWVAMWRPLQAYLYDWWPVRRRMLVFHKMSRIDVKVNVRAEKVKEGSIVV